jgi:hypothetical protein
MMPFLTPILARAQEVARTALGTAGYHAEYEAGKRMSRGTAIGLALGEPAAEAPPEQANRLPRHRWSRRVQCPWESARHRSPAWSPTA